MCKRVTLLLFLILNSCSYINNLSFTEEYTEDYISDYNELHRLLKDEWSFYIKDGKLLLVKETKEGILVKSLYSSQE